jgi:formate hydrogenlyase subunit 3/multisubunit Na+/H+ antiporter MnhD subunit
MVAPIHIISTALAVAFAIGILGKLGKNAAISLVLLTLAFMTFVSAQWFMLFFQYNLTPEFIFTAGFRPPISINLKMGMHEAFFTLLINSIGLLGGIYFIDAFREKSKNLMTIFLVLIMGLNVTIMTRDIFNLFVFLEISSIATAGLILLDENLKSLQSGFKYLIASSLISGFLLIGIVFAYYFSGSLNIDDLVLANISSIKGGFVVVFLILLSIILELKPFPANGWALDVYQATNPGISAIISAASASATIFVLSKLLPMANEYFLYILSLIGIFTFVASNLLGLSQKIATRLLGYSSIGQIGLMIAILGLSPFLGEKTPFILFGILITHSLAKVGLFWLAGIVKSENIKDWSVVRRNSFLLFLFGTFLFALIGFPPFPSFFAKWELIMQLANNQQYTFLILILVGSFIEAIYLFRWFGFVVKENNENLPEFSIKINKIIPVSIVTVGLYLVGYYTGLQISASAIINYLPLIFIAIIFAIDFLPIIFKNSISILGLAYYSYTIIPNYLENDKLRFIFAVIFLIGGILTFVAGYAYKGKRKGFYPVALLMYVGLAQIIQAENLLQFFFGWELMTAGSYFLIIRGKRSMAHALSYMLFSIGGAYLLLAGFALAHEGQISYSLEILSSLSTNISLIISLILVGFLTKTATLGLHIWLPGAHGEAESDVSPMVSAILLKAGVFGLIILFTSTKNYYELNSIAYILGWIGAITVLVANLAASFQEDAKRLLAYSSIGQLGYIVFALAMMTHLGWLAAFTYTINHFMYKAILFLAIGAVVLRVGTHNMYEMGGLIKKMPFAFIAVLIGIIALSGVPPLSGFAGKWLLYNAVILKGWYIQGAIAFFGGIIAFLYLFKLISSVFLGQLKDNHRNVKEISIWFIIPIYTLIIGLMIFAAKPEWILQPMGNIISQYFPNGGLNWNGGMATTSIGYWHGTHIMIIIGIMFAILFSWLAILSRKAQKVKQFNIVYSGERPFTPETTHVSHNIFAGYFKALGFLVEPWITNFWNFTSETIHDISDFFKRIYSGNGQTYLIHIMLYVVVIYFVFFN